MVRDISGLGSLNRNELRSDRNSESSSKTDNKVNADTASSAPKSTSGDQVELSSQAQTLKKLESQLADLPDVNEERVAALKSAIEKGEYTINNTSIAEKLLSTDALFGK